MWVAAYHRRMLADGTYEAIVVDATDGRSADEVVVELAVAAGKHKGEVVAVTATGLGRDPLDLLAVPATIQVRDGVPTLNLEA